MRSPSLPALRGAVVALGVFAGAALAPAGAQEWTGPRYRVEIPQHDRRLVLVEAYLPLRDSVLIMFPEGADHAPEGWSSYLRNLTATSETGQPVRLRRAGRDRWIIPRPFPRAVKLSYEVLLHHDAGPWPFGSKEAAYVKEDGVFVTGKALFITQRAMRPARVTFVLPERWRLATPWAEVPGDSTTFQVPDAAELLQVGMLAGRHQQRRLLLEGTTVILAIGQSLPGALDVFSEALGPALAGAAEIFGGTPRGKFVIIANADSYDGGTAFTRSFDVVFTQPPTRENRAEWSRLILHELLHLWLGAEIAPAEGEQEYWFTEGATDYLANLLQLRTGVITPDQFFERIAGHWDEYRSVAGTMSLRKAGEDKHANYKLVYSGGLLAAFVLDTELRRASRGQSGVEDLMRRLYAAHGRTDVPMTLADVERIATRLHGGSLDWLFSRYVKGTGLLPVPETLAHLGRALAEPRPAAESARSVIGIRPDITPAQRGLERSLLGQAGN